MASDFGARARKRSVPVAPILAIVALVLAAGVALMWWLPRSREIAKAEAWTFTGTPCPAVSVQAFAAFVVQPKESFEFGDVTFARGYGHASCEQITNDGGRGFGTHPVCQFTSPGVLHVTTKRGDFYFITQTGPATVAVQDGVASCVRAARFRGEQGTATDL